MWSFRAYRRLVYLALILAITLTATTMREETIGFTDFASVVGVWFTVAIAFYIIPMRRQSFRYVEGETPTTSRRKFARSKRPPHMTREEWAYAVNTLTRLETYRNVAYHFPDTHYETVITSRSLIDTVEHMQRCIMHYCSDRRLPFPEKLPTLTIASPDRVKPELWGTLPDIYRDGYHDYLTVEKLFRLLEGKTHPMRFCRFAGEKGWLFGRGHTNTAVKRLQAYAIVHGTPVEDVTTDEEEALAVEYFLLTTRLATL